MEWVILNPSSIHETFGLLGYTDEQGRYHIKDSCEDGLSELLDKLEHDNQYLRTRRTFGFMKTVSKDIAPLLTHASIESPKVLQKVIKLLAQLTLPLECLMSADFAETEEGQQIAFEMESLLGNIKTEFSKFRMTEVVVDYLKFASQKAELTSEECEEVADGLLLLRNLLHISVKEIQIHNQVLWNLFAHNVDKILLHLMTCSQNQWWGVSLVQLISLIYKDQHVSTLQRLLKLWLENSLSESSEDNESNTSPMGGNSSPMLTSDPTSDSSDNGGTQVVIKADIIALPAPPPKCYTKVKKATNRQTDADSGVSFNDPDDAGILKVQDSTSSNEEDTNEPKRLWPISCTQDKQKKKLHRKIKSKSALKQHHHPTEEDISHILREFTVHFLLEGYSSLVCILQDQLSKNLTITMDKSHFFWLITYFLKFASQLELDWEVISPVLDFKILSFLTFEGVLMCENLAVCKDDVKPHLRRMHLVVTSLKEFIQAVESYSKNAPSEAYQAIHQLQAQMVACKELRYLFVLLIRAFKPGVQSKQYLQDVIMTNHQLLMLLERISKDQRFGGDFQMIDYLKEFSNPLMMQQYGHLLEDFEQNGEILNDCLFTMMHHVAGDLNAPDALFQPLILKTFSNIWEVEFEIRDDWADLIEFVIHKFMKASTDEKQQIFKSGTSNISEETGFSKEDIEKLHWLYCQEAKTTDPIGTILENYKPCGLKTRESVLNQLLHQRIIGYNQFLQFLSKERLETNAEISSSEGSIRDPVKFNYVAHPSENSKYEKPVAASEKDVNEMLGLTRSDGVDVKWVQDQLLEICYCKLVLEGKLTQNACCEPVAYQSSLLGQCVPLVPWTKKQEYTLNSSTVILLLHKLGFHLATDVGKLFPRIPHFWTADVLFTVAEKLGPVVEVKFDRDLVISEGMSIDFLENSLRTTTFMGAGNIGPSFASPCTPMDWITLVQKSTLIEARLEEEHMDECASLTALPPTEVSGNVSVMSDEIEDSCDL